MARRSSGLSPLRASTLAVQAADAVRELIASGELQGGDRLIEAKIAEQLAVSRGPVREAFRLLGAEGLVREEPRRGTFVVRLTEADVRDVYDLRVALESRAARLSIELGDPEAVENLRGILDELREVAGEHSLAAQADYRFHEAVCRASGNTRLLDTFVRQATELRTLLRIDEELLDHEPFSIADEHEVLLAAIAAGDAERAEDAFRQHLETARDRIAAYMRAGGAGGDGRRDP
jgi:GntR family transcriptional regulator of gluconate operon